ncbi:MAG: HAD family hydrolase [Oscillospiraceae bacterium]|nr:HAD family hydrolase [Oscillospiraceae bacterium]
MIRTVLFDLDGTLLPMDQDEFTTGYFKYLVKKMAPHGYEPKALIDGIWAGTAAMVKNDGRCTNEEAFWADFRARFGEKAEKDKPLFEEFYAVEFQRAKDLCGYNEKAAQVVRALKRKGFRVGLATNPIFPAVATQSRIRWVGLEPEDFEFYTTYENSRHCKPNPAYYEDVLREHDIDPATCLMVGNDAQEDTAALKAGVRVFLITDCLINRDGRDIDPYPHGGFDDLMEYIRRENR